MTYPLASLQPSCVLFRGLPEAATPNDLANAGGPFAEEAAAAAVRGEEPPVRCPIARHVSLNSRLVYLDVGSEGAAKRLLEAAGRSAGLALVLVFPREAARWEAQLSSAQVALPRPLQPAHRPHTNGTPCRYQDQQPLRRPSPHIGLPPGTPSPSNCKLVINAFFSIDVFFSIVDVLCGHLSGRI